MSLNIFTVLNPLSQFSPKFGNATVSTPKLFYTNVSFSLLYKNINMTGDRLVKSKARNFDQFMSVTCLCNILTWDNNSCRTFPAYGADTPDCVD